MPNSTFVEIPEAEQTQMLAALRRTRYGYLLALHPTCRTASFIFVNIQR